MTIPHVLRAAAERIERDGWCQGGTGRVGEKCCAMRAVQDECGSPNGSRARTALETFRRYVGAVWVPFWNDTPGRTVDEVLAALRGAADAVERGES